MQYTKRPKMDYTRLHPGVLKHHRPGFTMELVDRLSLIPWMLETDYLYDHLTTLGNEKGRELWMKGIPVEDGRLFIELKERASSHGKSVQVNVVHKDESDVETRWSYRDFIDYKPHRKDTSLLGRLRREHEVWCKKLFGFIEDLLTAITDAEYNKTILDIQAYGADMEGMVAYAINTLSWNISFLVTSQWVGTPPLSLDHLVTRLPKRFELTHTGGDDGHDYTLKIGKEIVSTLTIGSRQSAEASLIKFNAIPRVRVKADSYIPNLDKAHKRALFEGMMRALLNHHLVECSDIEHYRVEHESAHVLDVYGCIGWYRCVTGVP